MKQGSFLSLSWKSWFLSLGLHLIAGATLLFLGRAQAVDLTLVNLDSAPMVLQSPSKANPVDPDETWRKPWLVPVSKPAPTPLLQKEAPSPATGPASASPSAGGGNGEGFKSIAEVSQLPHCVNPLKPDYPEAAKRANIEGVVILQVDIDATGAVKKVEVIQGLGFGCDEAAVEAMRKSNFTPALGAMGEPVPVQIRFPYRFKFND